MKKEEKFAWMYFGTMTGFFITTSVIIMNGYETLSWFYFLNILWVLIGFYWASNTE